MSCPDRSGTGQVVFYVSMVTDTAGIIMGVGEGYLDNCTSGIILLAGAGGGRPAYAKRGETTLTFGRRAPVVVCLGLGWGWGWGGGAWGTI